MGDIFQEVDDEVRQARLMRLWAKYGRYLILALASIVVATGAKVGWDELRIRQMVAQSTMFSAGIDLAESGQHEQAALAFNTLANESGTGYSQLAALREAAALVDSGQPSNAISVYDELANAPDTQPLLAELSTILAAIQRLEQGLWNEAVSSLEPIALGSGPWQYLSQEIMALSRIQAGELGEARELLAALADDPTTPATIRTRARKVLAAIHGNSN
ncbi:MAG: tetratricopeptide repeat protein [Pseudomonadota bacterium]|nr:tetratricopeptide repeat protein [Pseudomonadota bacterium]